MVKRQVAYIVNIKDLVDGEYVKVEGEWEPNFINIGDRKVNRVNIIATVVSTEPDSWQVAVDDGTSLIRVRAFNDNKILKGVGVGDTIILIGRPREYGGEIYIVPEIVKKVSNLAWIEVRKHELGAFKAGPAQMRAPEQQSEEQVVEKVVSGKSETEQIYELIKTLDLGNGADHETIAVKSGIVNPDKVISALLEQGEIFETKPGRLKVLE